MNLAYILVASVILLAVAYLVHNARLRWMSSTDFARSVRSALDRGDARWAQRVFEERRQRSPGDMELLELYAARLMETEGNEAALARIADAACSADGAAAAPAWFLQGRLFNQIGHVPEAAEAYLRATKADPDFVDARINLGVALDEQGKQEEAIRAYNEVLAKFPTEDYAWNNKGKSLRDIGRFVESLECYRKAQELGHAHADESVRRILLYLGRIEEANTAARPTDELGRAYELRRSIGNREIVARGFDGHHTRPEFVHGMAEFLVDAAAQAADSPEGLKHGDTVHVVYPRVFAVARGHEIILGEKHSADSDIISEEVSDTARSLVQIRLLLEICDVAPVHTTPTMTAQIEPAALEASQVIFERVPAQGPNDSGWRIHTGSENPKGQTISLEKLRELHPGIQHVSTFPVATLVHAAGLTLHLIVCDGTVVFDRSTLPPDTHASSPSRS